MKYKGPAWLDYINKLSHINNRAAEEVRSFILQNHTDTEVMRFAFAIADRYGNAAATLTCEMYDSVAEAAGVNVPPAEPAQTPALEEIAKVINGTKKQENILPSAVSRLCKRTAADTLLNNALRDGAQAAWIPSGDTCAFCFTLASRGWEYVTKKTLKKGHAEHIHANCDCTYAVRFNTKDNVEGYDPDAMQEEYYAEGGINGLRRKFYAQNKDKINAQKRALYLRKKISNNYQSFSISDTIPLKDVYFGRSVGARALNYDVLDPETGESFKFAEDTRLQNSEVFAGKGVKKRLKEEVAEGLADQLGGAPEDWKHCKAIGQVDFYGEIREAEVHWFEAEGIGKHKFKIKRWNDEG